MPTPMVSDLSQLEDNSIISQNNVWVFEHCENNVRRIIVPKISILKIICLKTIYPTNTVDLKRTIELLPINILFLEELSEEKLQREAKPTLKNPLPMGTAPCDYCINYDDICPCLCPIIRGSTPLYL
ncbi:hypothetical protein HHI36_006803 [Cryptolaemus montrouzieri]|uniref:Uncharacterized protein n=1 Tax=Cryptolaemus montrouzieri TaxID=559131 RepID=A0ABD2NYI9_9CUCU